MTLEQINNLWNIGGISDFELFDMLNKRWTFLNKTINECTTSDSTWNEFHLWKSERKDIADILEKVEEIK